KRQPPGAVFFDYDGDGDQDLYVVSGGNEFPEGNEWYTDRLYRNDGVVGTEVNLAKANNVFTKPSIASGKTAIAFDYDKDGDQDLLVANRIVPQQYPRAASSILFENEGGSFKDVTAEYAEDLSKFGIVNDVLLTDFNEDGWPDFVAVGEWTGIGLFENQQGAFINIGSQSDLHEAKGWWQSVVETDLNKDGRKDFVIGNLGLNSKYKASVKQPFKVYANDFDENGSLDIVLSSKYKGEEVPFRGKECSSQQMPFIKEKFPTYDQFARASLDEVYGEDKLKAAVQLEVNGFESVVIINRSGGQFELKALPAIVQSIPMLDLVATDLNADGREDIIAAGNIYDTEVETPRLDHQYGWVLLANDSENYTAVAPAQSGLYLSGNVKSMQLLQQNGGQYLLVGKNNEVLSLYKIKQRPLN
ncbi:MAG: VCBS repeat-containing protein, partial [Bacteroidota bacterium]